MQPATRTKMHHTCPGGLYISYRAEAPTIGEVELLRAVNVDFRPGRGCGATTAASAPARRTASADWPAVFS